MEGLRPGGVSPARDGGDHWLVRPRTVRGLWIASAVVLASTLLAQAVIAVKPYFGIDGWPGFGAAFGFVSCLVMVVLAKGLGVLLKRRGDYYDA